MGTLNPPSPAGRGARGVSLLCPKRLLDDILASGVLGLVLAAHEIVVSRRLADNFLYVFGQYIPLL